MEHIKRSFVQLQTTSCPNHLAPSNSTSTTLQTQPCLTPSIPPLTPWSTLIRLLSHSTPSDKKTCPLYPCPSSWPSHLDHTHPSPQNAPTPMHLSHNIHTPLPTTSHDTPVGSSMKDHALPPSTAIWSTMKSRTPSQNWISKFRPKHPYKLDHTPTTISTQGPHTVVSPWRSWNPTSPSYTALCSGLSIPLKWKKSNTRWPKMASIGWQQKGNDIPRGTRRIETLHPLWTQLSILEWWGSVTGLGY